MNQVAKRTNSGINDGVNEQIAAMFKLMEDLHDLAMRDYGHR